ncbi:MAG: TIR domain-containing protein, partial [Pyrinomonadaceae bacterium]
LVATLGSASVFKDVNDIPPGSDFRETLRATLDTCDSLIAIIGPKWTTIADAAGRRRIHDPNDYVRIEVASALRRRIPTIPVLVDAATLPRTEDLPLDLKSLTSRQAIPVRFDPDFQADATRLADFLIELHIVDGLICQSENALKAPLVLGPIEDESLFHSLTEAIANDSSNTNALMLRGQFAYTWARAQGGQGYRQAIEDFRRCIGLDGNLSDPHFGLGTVYYQLAIFDLVKRGCYRIHQKGKIRVNEETRLPEMKTPIVELFFDDQSRAVQALALKELQTGLALQQHSRQIEEATAMHFAPTDIMKRLTSLRMMLGLQPAREADDTMLMVFWTFHMRMCEAGTEELFEVVAASEKQSGGSIFGKLRKAFPRIFGQT